MESRLHPRRQRLGVPVSDARDAAQRQRLVARVRRGWPRSWRRASAPRGGRRPRRRPRTGTSSCRTTTVQALVDVSTAVSTSISSGLTPSASAATCAATVACPWPCGVVPISTVIPPSGEIATVAPSALPDFGQAGRALLGCQRERDVAHVRDRRLDAAGDADPVEAAVLARLALLLAPRLVARRARAHRRGSPRSRPSRRARPRACGRGTRPRRSGCGGRAPPGRARAVRRRSPSSARGPCRAAGRRSRG